MRFLSSLTLAPCAAILTAVLSGGCESKNSTAMSNAKEKIADAADATVAAAKEKRDEFTKSMQKKLDELDTKYKDLEKRATEAKDDAKKDLEKKVAAAKSKRDAAAKKLGELKDASQDRWEKVKDSVENAFDELIKAFD